MALDKYFDKFPQITYANNNVVDISKRVALLDRVSRNPYIFYPYDITSEERADQLSSRYYNDSFKSWIIYLSNNIVDPYYEWYLTEREFLDFIVLKYGSIFNAQQKIKFYRNNWENQEPISISAYNALSNDMKKYWNPNYAVGSAINSYSRKEVDWSSSTNKVMSYTVADTQFIQDEVVNIYLDSKSLGKGQIVGSSNTEIYVQHVSGYFQESDDLTIGSVNINVNSTGFTNTGFEIADASSKFKIGDRIYYNVSTGDIPLTPLTGNTYYYISGANTTSIKLANTQGGANIFIIDSRNTTEVHKVYYGAYVYGTESNVNTMILDSNLISTNIPEDELNYWKPITYYDYEQERNEFNKSIRLIDSKQSETVVSNLTELLKE